MKILIIIGICAFSSSCFSPPLSEEEEIIQISQDLESLSPESNSKQDFLNLEVTIEKIFQLNQANKVSKKPCFQVDLLRKSLSLYQIMYFAKPSQNRWKKLHSYYKREKNVQQNCSQSPKEFYAFSKVKKILDQVQEKSKNAHSHLKQIITFLEVPANWKNFAQQILKSWEVGGVIKIDQNQILLQVIPDEKQKTYRIYFNQFQNNNFSNLPQLKKAFLSRLYLRKVGTDRDTNVHTDIVLKIVQETFSIIEQVQDPKNEIGRRQLHNAKKLLLRLGLERKLLHGSYSLDYETYLYDSEVVFFFHTHPFRSAPYFYLKKPSGQDREITFRTGPALVFDIQKDFIDLYLVVMGESQKVKRFRPIKLPRK